jgi:hypothetical protein
MFIVFILSVDVVLFFYDKKLFSFRDANGGNVEILSVFKVFESSALSARASVARVTVPRDDCLCHDCAVNAANKKPQAVKLGVL